MPVAAQQCNGEALLHRVWLRSVGSQAAGVAQSALARGRDAGAAALQRHL